MTIEELKAFLYSELSKAKGPLNHYPWMSSCTGSVHRILQIIEGKEVILPAKEKSYTLPGAEKVFKVPDKYGENKQ